MAAETTYREYVADREFERGYAEHQQRWRESVRESDRVLLRRIAAIRAALGRPLSLLDIGCSTGNLLYHLRGASPDDELVGADLMAETVQRNAADPALAEIRFDVADVTVAGTDFIVSADGEKSMEVSGDAEPTVVFRCGGETFILIAYGRLRPADAIEQGKLQVAGDRAWADVFVRGFVGG